MSVMDRRNEMLPRAQLEQVQLERLQALVARLRRNVRRYREKLSDVQVGALADLQALPLTTPQDMVESFPYGMFAFPLREIIRLYSMLGPDGMPLVIGHTRNDLAQWGRLAARQLAAAGVTPNDVVQVALGRSGGSSTAGYVLGSELLEASVIAEDPLHIDYQFEVLKNYRPTFLITTPTHALELTRTMEQRRMDPQALQLRAVILSRPVSAQLREQLAAGLFTTVRCNFGIPELLDPGLPLECEAGQMHIQEDQFLPEIVDGELVITALSREALPLLRYRTQIRASLNNGKCSCGRTSRIVQPTTRLDKRCRVGEVEYYETQVRQVLKQTRAAGSAVHLRASERRLILDLEMSQEVFGDTVASPQETKRSIESELLTRLGVESEVRFIQPQANAAQAQGI